MKQLKYLLILLSVNFSTAGCKKLVEAEMPSDRITQTAVFNNESTADAAVVGLYTQMIRANLQFGAVGATLYTGLTGDDLLYTSSAPTTQEFANNEIATTNPVLRSNLWTPPYQLIYQANAILEGLQNSTGIGLPTKSQLEGEARFIRAFSLFYLANMFGDVPLVLSTRYDENRVIPRTPRSQVYEQVITDLLAAKNLLTASYPAANRIRANRWAAATLLARVYLYNHQWQQAESEATSVISSGLYSLLSNLNNVFLMNSNETIWQLMPTATTLNTWEGNVFIPATSGTPLYPLNSSLVNAFSSGDLRKNAWTKTVAVGSNTYTHPFKYKIKTGTPITEYYVVLRLAELYLVRSEARARQDKISLALSDLNIVRNRAGLANATASDQAAMLLAVEQERRLELFAEWGHRWFDLKRTGRANALLTLKPGWQATDTLYPIPNAELLRNPMLTQNPGY